MNKQVVGGSYDADTRYFIIWSTLLIIITDNQKIIILFYGEHEIPYRNWEIVNSLSNTSWLFRN